MRGKEVKFPDSFPDDLPVLSHAQRTAMNMTLLRNLARVLGWAWV